MHSLKMFLDRHFYFVVAWYFRFWAQIRLKLWHPKIIVITGSAGKTTLLHMVESQLGELARYSHHANNAYGVSYDILGLKGIKKSKLEWFRLFLAAPFGIFKPKYKEDLYVVELDADRPDEAKFTADMLKPSATAWVSTLHTHTTFYDKVVLSGKFDSQEDAVAYEYGHLIEQASELAILNGDSELMTKQLHRTKAKVVKVHSNDLKKYTHDEHKTNFNFDGVEYSVPALVPRVNFYQVAMVNELLKYLKIEPDYQYKNFSLPPGRSSVFKGVKGTTIIDSSYNNSNINSLEAIVEMFEEYKAKDKWLVVGDMLEQGKNEAREHEKIADLLNKTHFNRVLLMGHRINKHAKPLLSEELKKRTNVLSFYKPKQVLSFLHSELKGGEVILFKGAGFMEVIIEGILLNPDDKNLLVRREPIWNRTRAKAGVK